jgi:hypothetical protein
MTEWWCSFLLYETRWDLNKNIWLGGEAWDFLYILSAVCGLRCTIVYLIHISYASLRLTIAQLLIFPGKPWHITGSKAIELSIAENDNRERTRL